MTNAHWRAFGEAPTTALAFHCSLAHGGAWRGVAAHLSPALSFQAMDLPGHGESPAWPQGQDYGDVAVAWAKEKLTQPMHLMGHSFGAYVAIRLAIECPEKVLSLSLFEPVFFAAAAGLEGIDIAAYRAAMAEIADLVDQGRADEGARIFVRSWGDGRRWHDLPEVQRAQFAALMPAVLQAQVAILEDVKGYAALLGEISCPTLLMDGSLSHPTMPLVQNAIASSVQNGRRVTLAGVGHMGVITHPELIGKAFSAHLASLD